MPTITITETNPTYVAPSGGGRRALVETEVNPTYVEGHGGGRIALTETEINPTLLEEKTQYNTRWARQQAGGGKSATTVVLRNAQLDPSLAPFGRHRHQRGQTKRPRVGRCPLSGGVSNGGN